MCLCEHCFVTDEWTRDSHWTERGEQIRWPSKLYSFCQKLQESTRERCDLRVCSWQLHSHISESVLQELQQSVCEGFPFLKVQLWGFEGKYRLFVKHEIVSNFVLLIGSLRTLRNNRKLCCDGIADWWGLWSGEPTRGWLNWQIVQVVLSNGVRLCVLWEVRRR